MRGPAGLPQPAPCARRASARAGRPAPDVPGGAASARGCARAQAGATAVVPETLEPGLQLASAVLSQLNMPPDDVQEAIQSFRRNHLMELQARAPRGGRAAARAALRRGTPGPACCGVGASAWRRSASGHGAGPATRHRVATNPNPLCKAAARGRGGPDCARTGRRRCARTAGRRWGTALAAARWTRARTRRGRATMRRARPWRMWLCRRLVRSALGASGCGYAQPELGRCVRMRCAAVSLRAWCCRPGPQSGF